MLQTISISNKCCSFDLLLKNGCRYTSNTSFDINNNMKYFLSIRSVLKNVTVKYGVMLLTNQLYITIINYNSKYIKTENINFTILQYMFIYFLLNKCSFGECKGLLHETTKHLTNRKKIKNLTNLKIVCMCTLILPNKSQNLYLFFKPYIIMSRCLNSLVEFIYSRYWIWNDSFNFLIFLIIQFFY